MPTLTTRTLFMLGLAGLSSVANSAEKADSPTTEIVVTGQGLPDGPATPAYDVQVITRDQIAVAPSGRIEDVLADAAGFQQFRRSDSRSANPSAQGATLRALGGNAASRTLVLLDGVPLADPMFGSVPFSAIDPARLSAIRVTRGGGSGAFGSGAVAGTIAMDSAGPSQLGLFSGEADVDQRGETELSGALAPRLGNGFAVISGRWDRGEGFYTTPLDQRVPASVRARYDSWSTGLRAVAPISSDVELQAGGLLYDDRRTLRFAGADSHSSGQNASLRLVAHGPWQVDALAYLQTRGFSNVVISSTTFRKTLNQRETPSTGIGGKLELRPPVGHDQLLRFGVDGRSARGDLIEDSFNSTTGAVAGHRHAGGRNDDLGLFAQDDWTLGTLVLTGGVREDNAQTRHGYITVANAANAVTSASTYGSRGGWALSGRGGALWHVLPTLTLRASAYSSIRQPTLNELYRTYTVFPVTVQANPALGNERLVGYEGGVDFTPAGWAKLSLTGFSNRVDHAIANVTVGTNLQLRENVQAIRANGVEAQASAKLGRVGFDGSLAWTDAVVEAPGAALDGHRPAQTPRIAASAVLSWQPHWLGRDGWLLSASLRHVGAQFEDDLSTSILPPATTLGAVAQAPLGRGFTMVVRAENLTDTTVETRNQAGSIDLAAPRTVYVGVKVGLR
jgi:outer membrane receptor protein involved in Fe transport